MPLRLRSDVATTHTDEGAVLLDERTGKYWQVNLVGADVLRQLDSGRHLDEIADRLTGRYRVEWRRVRDDVSALTGQLRAAGLLEQA